VKSEFKVLVVTSILTFDFALCTVALTAQSPPKSFISYSDARPIIEALRADLLPPELRDQGPAAREALWPEWIARHDAAIRARVEAGDEDSVVHLLLYGTTFTRQPPIGEQELAGIVVEGRGAAERAFVPSPVLTARLSDFLAALASPGANERLEFARQVIGRRGLDPTAADGRERLRRYLEERIVSIGRAERTARLLDPDTSLGDKLTLFRDRGLSSDTSIFTDFGVEQALDAIKASGVLPAGSVRRVAIVGPGLDVIDKLDGYDFYPEQTVQPFALIDSLHRFELAEPDRLEVVAFDVSARVLRHLETARAGRSYTVVLPRNLERPWSPELADYWERLGNWIGEAAPRVPAAPPNAGRVAVRAVAVRPSAVASVTSIDLNIVTERLALPGAPFDLIVATNILLYYDVFDQSLAIANIAGMLRPGGLLLTNNRIIELPDSPLTSVGHLDVGYMTLSGIGQTGDRFTWYARSR